MTGIGCVTSPSYSTVIHNPTDKHFAIYELRFMIKTTLIMKTRTAVLLFVSGILLGISLTLAIGAGTAPNPSRSRLTVFTYPSGTTGFFDPDTGRLYVYDMNLATCISVREIGTLGDPLRPVR